MTNKEFAQKYNIPIEIARYIIHKYPTKIRVATFHVYNEFDPEDKELIKMNKYLKEHHECEKHWWRDFGPCSNWGYDIWRLETKNEFENRIRKEIRKTYKKINFLNKHKIEIQKMTKDLSATINLK